MHRPNDPYSYPLRVHTGTRQAYILIKGKRKYLGRADLPQTEQAYRRTVAELLLNGGVLVTAKTDVSVCEMLAAFWEHAKTHYRKPNGTPTKTIEEIRRSAKVLKELYGDTPANDFGPRALKVCRSQIIRSGAARSTVNARTAWIKNIFAWGVENEMVPGGVRHALDCVKPLERGRTEAPEGEPVGPVMDAHVEAVRDHVAPQVWAMIQLQLLSGARPGEVVRLRAIDFDRSIPEVWTAKLADHKTAHKGRTRTLYFNEAAQAILKEFMQERPIHLPIFSPKDAERARHAKAAGHRRPDQKPKAKKTNRTLRESYTTNSYCSAIGRGCDKAGVPRWAPNQLRHTAGTKARIYGLDVAQVFLGHASAKTTEIYAEADKARMLAFVSQHRG